MAFKKGLCPHCGNSTNIKDHSFLVNMNSETIFCPKCARKIKPLDAVNRFESEINKVLHKSSYTLIVDADAPSAYQVYGMCINLDPENVEAHYGRILTLIYSSKMHKSLMKEVITLFDNERMSLYRKSTDKQAYLKFISRANYAVYEYITKIKKAVIFKNCIYDTECIKVYFGRISEVLEFQNLLMEELLYLSKHYDDSKTCTYISFLKNDMETKNSTLHSPIRCVDGKLYSFIKIDRNGETEIMECGKRIDTHLTKYRMATFDFTNKKLRHIDENVFHKMTGKIILCNLSFLGMVLFYISGIILLTIGLAKELSSLMFALFIGFGGLSLLLAIGCTVYFAIMNAYIKRRKKRVLV